MGGEINGKDIKVDNMGRGHKGKTVYKYLESKAKVQGLIKERTFYKRRKQEVLDPPTCDPTM